LQEGLFVCYTRCATSSSSPEKGESCYGVASPFHRIRGCKKALHCDAELSQQTACRDQAGRSAIPRRTNSPHLASLVVFCCAFLSRSCRVGGIFWVRRVRRITRLNRNQRKRTKKRLFFCRSDSCFGNFLTFITVLFERSNPKGASHGETTDTL
jgi:hypothetical protein